MNLLIITQETTICKSYYLGEVYEQTKRYNLAS